MSNEKLLEQTRKRKIVAQRLRRRLRELDITQDQAAQKVGVSKRTMEYWLAGRGPIRKLVLAAFGCDENSRNLCGSVAPIGG